jgi:hypothetical protein
MTQVNSLSSEEAATAEAKKGLLSAVEAAEARCVCVCVCVCVLVCVYEGSLFIPPSLPLFPPSLPPPLFLFFFFLSGWRQQSRAISWRKN